MEDTVKGQEVDSYKNSPPFSHPGRPQLQEPSGGALQFQGCGCRGLFARRHLSPGRVQSGIRRRRRTPPRQSRGRLPRACPPRPAPSPTPTFSSPARLGGQLCLPTPTYPQKPSGGLLLAHKPSAHRQPPNHTRWNRREASGGGGQRNRGGGSAVYFEEAEGENALECLRGGCCLFSPWARGDRKSRSLPPQFAFPAIQPARVRKPPAQLGGDEPRHAGGRGVPAYLPRWAGCCTKPRPECVKALRSSSGGGGGSSSNNGGQAPASSSASCAPLSVPPSLLPSSSAPAAFARLPASC